jgi:hypothetical protein
VIITHAVRRSLLTSTVAATSLALIAVAGLPAARAARSHPTGLHVAGTVQIATGSVFTSPITQAPGGTVYFGRGKSVFMVHGTAKPALVRTLGGKVVGLGASSAELFVEVGRTVTEYKRSDGVEGRHWHLSSPHAVREAALFPVGSTVWVWTDWAGESGGEGTGAEPATISRFSTSSSIVHKITGNGAQELLAADSAGAYFVKFGGGLEHVSPGGTVHSVKYAQFPGALALAGGRVEILALHFVRSTTRLFIDAYKASDLKKSFSQRVSLNDFALAATGAGLLDLSCPTASCSTGKVQRLNPANGKIVASVPLPFGSLLVPGGPGAVVITQVKDGATNDFFLTRLAA